MNNDITFQPVGFIKGCFRIGLQENVFALTSQKELQVFWDTIPEQENVRFDLPKIDFANKKLLVVKDSLRSISCFLLVYKIEKIAEDILQIGCAEVSDGGACAGALGNAYQFLAVERNLHFSSAKLVHLQSKECLEDFDQELKELGQKIEEGDLKELGQKIKGEGYSFSGRRELCDSYTQKAKSVLEKYLGSNLRVYLPPSQPENPKPCQKAASSEIKPKPSRFVEEMMPPNELRFAIVQLDDYEL